MELTGCGFWFFGVHSMRSVIWTPCRSFPVSLCQATYMPRSMPGSIGTPMVFGTLMSSVSVPAPSSRSGAG
jgi:hypothetical protein